MLKRENYYAHNYHNDKVFEWVLKNHKPTEIMGNTSGFETTCDVYEKRNESGHSLGFFIEDKDNDETRYYDYTDSYDPEDIISVVGGLSDAEKAELLDIQTLYVYYCPFCEQWSMDGANI